MKTEKINATIFTGHNTVQQINDWLAKNSVRIINIETMIKSSGGSDSVEVKLGKSGTKVWYEEVNI